jgi:hypothetical protein
VMLVPLTVLTFVLVVLYGLRIWMARPMVGKGKSVDDEAEERVERLQGEE